MRPSDYAVWAGATAAFPSALYFWGMFYQPTIRAYQLTMLAPPEMADPTKSRLRPALRLGGVFGFIGGFLLAYQRSSCELLCYFLPATRETTLTLCMPCLNLSPFLGLVGE
jgi:hypothetical protein